MGSEADAFITFVKHIKASSMFNVYANKSLMQLKSCIKHLNGGSQAQNEVCWKSFVNIYFCHSNGKFSVLVENFPSKLSKEQQKYL